MFVRPFAVLAALAVAGCGKFSSAPELPFGDNQSHATVILESFQTTPAAAAGPDGVIRVGWYHDFSQYDSLQIDVSVVRVSPVAPFDRFLIKVGPAYSLCDSLSAAAKDFSFMVKRSDLAKPKFAALVLMVPDPDVVLQFSRLRVIGWAWDDPDG